VETSKTSAHEAASREEHAIQAREEPDVVGYHAGGAIVFTTQSVLPPVGLLVVTPMCRAAGGD
jgi:hypothetical protein